MKLDQRKEQILNFIVRDYIKSAAPISSGRIDDEEVLDASPATIRSIMLELDEEGYLTQPHTSAGRIPTEAGYRYFVKYLMEEREPPLAMQKEMDAIIDRFTQDTDALFDELSHTLARELRLFSGAGIFGKSARFFGYGLAEVFQEPEFFKHEETVKFGKFIDHIDEGLNRTRRLSNKNVARDVSIGPFGMVTVCARNDILGECVIFSAGPRRMNYEKANAFLKYAVDDIIGISNKP